MCKLPVGTISAISAPPVTAVMNYQDIMITPMPLLVQWIEPR